MARVSVYAHRRPPRAQSDSLPRPCPHLHHPHARYPIELGEREGGGMATDRPVPSPLAPFIPGRRNRFTSFSPRRAWWHVCVRACSTWMRHKADGEFFRWVRWMKLMAACLGASCKECDGCTSGFCGRWFFWVTELWIAWVRLVTWVSGAVLNCARLLY